VRFTATLTEANEVGGRWVACPFDGREVFGAARPRVTGTVNGTPFRTRLAVYGGATYLGFTAELRQRAGIELGSLLEIDIEPDDTPPEVDIPADLAAVLGGNPAAAAAFDALAFTNRKEYADWVGSAKRVETRQRRVQRAVQMLLDGVRHP